MHAFAMACSKIANTIIVILKRKRDLNWNKMKVSAVKAGVVSKGTEISSKRIERGLSLLDFILRIVAATATIAGALAMGTAKETLPFATLFVRFRARFNDLPTFVFFVITNSLVCGYLLLTLMLSFFHIVWSKAVKSRILLVFLDTVMFGFLITATSAATAIVYVAHHGNPNANWFAICQQYNNFCQRISGSLLASYVAVVLFMVIIFPSQVVISRH